MAQGWGVVPSWIPLLRENSWAGVYHVCDRPVTVDIFTGVGGA